MSRPTEQEVYDALLLNSLGNLSVEFLWWLVRVHETAADQAERLDALEARIRALAGLPSEQPSPAGRPEEQEPKE
jgi:hypothetical protein